MWTHFNQLQDKVGYTVSVNIVSFYSLKPESSDRPFGFYADEEATTLVMETLIAAFDVVNSKRDKTDADWTEWRNLKDITNKLMLSYIKYTRDKDRRCRLPYPGQAAYETSQRPCRSS